MINLTRSFLRYIVKGLSHWKLPKFPWQLVPILLIWPFESFSKPPMLQFKPAVCSSHRGLGNLVGCILLAAGSAIQVPRMMTHPHHLLFSRLTNCTSSDSSLGGIFISPLKILIPFLQTEQLIHVLLDGGVLNWIWYFSWDLVNIQCTAKQRDDFTYFRGHMPISTSVRVLFTISQQHVIALLFSFVVSSHFFSICYLCIWIFPWHCSTSYGSALNFILFSIPFLKFNRPILNVISILQYTDCPSQYSIISKQWVNSLFYRPIL